jgi:hypothetical protein
VESLSKIEIPKAEIHQGQITQSKSGAKLPVNNGLRLLQLLINPEQADRSDIFTPEELVNLNKMFTDVGIRDVSSLFVKGAVSRETNTASNVSLQPKNMKTGITEDFWNEFHAIKLSYEGADGVTGLQNIKNNLRRFPCPTYEKRYPKAQQPHLYNAQTKSTIASLNNLVSQLNQGIQNNTITLAKIKTIYDAAAKLVYGDDTKIKWPAEWQ